MVVGRRSLWRAPRRATVGYIILALGAVAGFVRVETIANRQDHVIEQAAAERAANVARFEAADRRIIAAARASDARFTSALRTMLCTLRNNTLTSSQRTPDEKLRVIAFYQVALNAIKAKPCLSP